MIAHERERKKNSVERLGAQTRFASKSRKQKETFSVAETAGFQYIAVESVKKCIGNVATRKFAERISESGMYLAVD